MRLYLMLAMFYILSKNNIEGKKFITLLNSVNCPEYPDVPYKMTSFKRSYNRKNQTVLREFEILEEVSPEGLISIIDVLKCQPSGAPDTCEYIMKNYKADFCEAMMAKGKPWSDLIETIEPKATCPLKVGHYRTEYALKEGGFTILPFPSGVYKVRFVVRNKEKMVWCLDNFTKVTSFAS
ncbi:hypothetical protein HHI36_019985 [Cryptolaemus montrouzieri]|uniref:MD-2-related lipid-recognition domain-containing protein n=1 Tax=Cryptolaemus montrouzieri TaxID=559131 RepID=A0ABD2NAI4_9CUCU